MLAATIARYAPPNPARAPDTTTAMYLYLMTLTPSVAAAYGASPHDRSRRPKAVRHSTKNVPTTSRIAMIVT